MRERYKAIFVDWNGTLSKSELFDHLDNPEHPRSTLHTTLRDTINNLWPIISKPWMLGQLSSENIAQLISFKSNVPYEVVMEEIIEGNKSMQIDEEALGVIAEIRKRGLKVVIATGNVDAFDRWTVPALGLHDKFDGIMNSANLKAMKKDIDHDGSSLFFRDFLKANNIDPTLAVIIDDSPDKNGAIQGFGIKYVQLQEGRTLVNILNDILSNSRN